MRMIQSFWVFIWLSAVISIDFRPNHHIVRIFVTMLLFTHCMLASTIPIVGIFVFIFWFFFSIFIFSELFVSAYWIVMVTLTDCDCDFIHKRQLEGLAKRYADCISKVYIYVCEPMGINVNHELDEKLDFHNDPKLCVALHYC